MNINVYGPMHYADIKTSYIQNNENWIITNVYEFQKSIFKIL